MPDYTSGDSSNSGPWIEAGDFQHFAPDPHVYPQKHDLTPSTQGQAYYSLPGQPYYTSRDSSNSGPWVEAGDVQDVVLAPHVYHQEQDFTPITQGQAYYSLPAQPQPYYASWDSSSSGPWVEAGDVQHLLPAPSVYNQEQDFTPITLGHVYYSLPAQPQPYYTSRDSSSSGPWVEVGDVQHVVPAPHVYHQEQDFTPITQGQAYYSLPAQLYYPSWDTFSCSGPLVEAGDLPHPIPSSHVYHQEQIFTPSTQGQNIWGPSRKVEDIRATDP